MNDPLPTFCNFISDAQIADYVDHLYATDILPTFSLEIYVITVCTAVYVCAPGEIVSASRNKRAF